MAGKVTFQQDRCKGCELCRAMCPKNLIAMKGPINAKGYTTAVIENQEDCIGCQSCAIMCPDGAIEIWAE